MHCFFWVHRNSLYFFFFRHPQEATLFQHLFLNRLGPTGWVLILVFSSELVKWFFVSIVIRVTILLLTPFYNASHWDHHINQEDKQQCRWFIIVPISTHFRKPEPNSECINSQWPDYQVTIEVSEFRSHCMRLFNSSKQNALLNPEGKDRAEERDHCHYGGQRRVENRHQE